jgi:3',5'-cyclic AMP phosphodiesterase CpdA
MQRKILSLAYIFIFAINLSGQPYIRFSGKVYDGKQGISGVAVTDGYNVTYTDRKGMYTLLSDTVAEFVYISLPSGYDIPLSEGVPCFYTPVTNKTSKKQTINFGLKKSDRDETKHTMIVWADPQLSVEEELLLLANAAGDVEALAETIENPVYGVVCGDIVDDKPVFYNDIKQLLGVTGVPFFFVPGNHDVTFDVRSEDLSKAGYKQTFGPNYYSFNRGKVHYVVLDNIFYSGNKSVIMAYLHERQLRWLERNLSSVAPGSTVVVILHVPTTYNKELQQDNVRNVMQNRNHLHDILKPYNVHIFSGHTHCNENFVIRDNLFEHVQGALCGAFWQTPYCSDGAPLGYGVYEFDGDHLTWYYKAIGYDKDFQFRVYPAGFNPEKPTAVTVNVWNYDPQWQVRWYENGVPQGAMTQYNGLDPEVADYTRKNRDTMRYQWIAPIPTNHLFYAEPSSPDAEITIQVTDRFGNTYIQKNNL